MLYPAMSELLKHVESRYLLVNVVAHRARQLSIESELTHEPLTDKPVTIAINEVANNTWLQRRRHWPTPSRLFLGKAGEDDDCTGGRELRSICHRSTIFLPRS